MKTKKLPPICPFGCSDGDAVNLRMPGSSLYLFAMNPEKTIWMRIFNSHDDDYVSYLIGTRDEIETAVLDWIDELEDCVEHDDNLNELGMSRVELALR